MKLPCGTFTLLFTDIEGSSRLVRELDAAARLLGAAESERTS